MLNQYTFVRDSLQERDELLKRATRYSELQEGVIAELRMFIEENLWDVLEALGNRDDGVDATYKKGASGGGKAALDRMASPDPLDRFDL